MIGSLWATLLIMHLDSPPAAADAALEQFGQSIHKRPHQMHLVLIPRLMTFRWRKLLGKICDLVFMVPLGTEPWGVSKYEPLIVALYLPLSRHEPWRLHRTPMLEHVKRSLHDLLPATSGWGWLVLHELLQQAQNLESMPVSMVRPLLHHY
jgi:hypothetical protein